LCKALDPENPNSLVSATVPLNTKGECMTYLLGGGTLRVLAVISGSVRAYVSFDASGRAVGFLLENGFPEPSEPCVIWTEWIETQDGALRVELTADAGETASTPVPDGFYLTFVAGSGAGLRGNGLQSNFNGGGGGQFYAC
jgi:hypothetical protein